MIDWLSAVAYASDIVSRGKQVWDAMEELDREGSALRNRDFPLSPLPLLIRSSAAAQHYRSLEDYVGLLGKCSRLYLADSSVRQWYGLTKEEEALVRADRRLGEEVVVCRLDGYLEQATERLVLLENNADAPAGTLFTPRLNNRVQQVLERVGLRTSEMSALTYWQESDFVSALRGCARRAGLPEPQCVAVMQLAGSATCESKEIVKLLQRAGIEAYLADPRELRVVRGRVRFAGRPADACWNKVNTSIWRTVMSEDQEAVDRWLEAVSDASFVHVNPFCARYVAENKLTLALPQEPQLADLFTEYERQLAARLLPWSRRLTGQALAPDGSTALTQDLLEHQNDYVLKQPYDIRGDGVTIGRATPRGRWHAAVRRARTEIHLVQRYVPATAYPVIRQANPGLVAMPTSMDTYLFSGKVAGFGSKASLSPRVNVFQGGQKLAVHVVEVGAVHGAG